MQHIAFKTFSPIARMRTITFACVASLAATVLLSPAAAATSGGQPNLQTIEQGFQAALAELRAIRRGLDTLEADIVRTAKDNGGALKCAPETPNKDTFNTRLSAYYARLGGARGQRRAVQNAIDIQRVAVDWSEQIREYDIIYASTSNKANFVRDDVLARVPPSAQDCQPQRDPISAVNVTATSVRPGETTTITVTATTRSGGALTLTDVTITGAGDIGTLGGARGVGTTSVSFDLDVADPRRHGPFNLRVNVKGNPPAPAGKPAPPAENGSTGHTYTVRNAPPEFVSAPGAIDADPGQRLSLRGDVVIRDANADDKNAGEIRRGALTTGGHPNDLDATPKFDRVGVNGFSHDGATGQYTISVTRDSTVAYPHRHRAFDTTLKIVDSKGATAESDLELVVNNVAPTITLDATPDRFVSDDNRTVALSGRVVDGNFNQDIEKITVDAVDAGGRAYAFGDGSITRTPDGDDAYRLRFDPAEFPHTRIEGPHVINGEVSDGGWTERGQAPLTGTGDTDIFVGNEPPNVTGVGYGRDTTRVGAGGQVLHACPGDSVQLVATANDPDRDAIRVTGTVTNADQISVATVNMTDDDGNGAFDGVLTAPAPGTYTITYQAVESGTATNKGSNTLSVTLIVDDCGGPRDEPRTDLGDTEETAADDTADDSEKTASRTPDPRVGEDDRGVETAVTVLVGETPTDVIVDGGVAVDFNANPVTDFGVNLSDNRIDFSGVELGATIPAHVRDWRRDIRFNFLYVEGSDDSRLDYIDDQERATGFSFLERDDELGTGISFNSTPIETHHDLDFRRIRLNLSTPLIVLDGERIPFNPFNAFEKRIDLGFEHDFSDLDIRSQSFASPFDGEFGVFSNELRADSERERFGLTVDALERWKFGGDDKFEFNAGLGVSVGYQQHEVDLRQRVTWPQAFNNQVVEQRLKLEEDDVYVDARASVGLEYEATPRVTLRLGAEFVSEDFNRLETQSDGQGRFYRFNDVRKNAYTAGVGLKARF